MGAPPAEPTPHARMCSNTFLQPTNEPSGTANRLSPMHREGDTSTAMVTTTQEPNRESGSSRTDRFTRGQPVVIEGQEIVWCVAFLVDGEHVVSGGDDGKIRCWRIEDGSEVGTPMDALSAVMSISVSRDGKWIVSGSYSGMVRVWNTETHEKVNEFKGHNDWVFAVDFSPDAAKIATGSGDCTACVWSRSTGGRLQGPWKHAYDVVTAKFSPHSRLIATATVVCGSVRIYDAQDGHLLFDVAIRVGSFLNNSLTWSSDGMQLFTLSEDGNIHCLDVSAGPTISKWAIHDAEDVQCIALASNDTFVAASARSSVSFWDTVTQKQIGSVIQLNHEVESLAISEDHDLVASGTKVISIRSLWDVLPSSYLVNTQDTGRTIKHLLIRLASSEERVRERDDLIRSLLEGQVESRRTVEELRIQLADTRRAADQQKVTQNELLRSLETRANDEIAQLKRANQQLESIVHVHEQKYQCEALLAQGRTFDAARFLLEVENTAGEHLKGNKFLSDWLAEYTSTCVKELEKSGDEASNAGKREETVAAYAAVLSLERSTTDVVLAKWASAALANGSARQAMCAATKFKVSQFAVFRVISKFLEELGRLSEAVEAFQQMRNDLQNDTSTDNGRALWEREFRERCVQELIRLGDIAKEDKKHDEAIQHYSDAISLDPTNVNEIILKRGNELIELDPLSHKGYGEKHVALDGMGHYSEAFKAFKAMLSILERSRDPKIRELRHQFVDATTVVRREVEEAVRDLPTVLIDTDTGRLYDKAQQAAAFEELPIYDELRSSMTTTLDQSRIRKEVTEFYRYVMFSHKWQSGEPTFQQIQNDSVYSLPSSPTFDKLRNFCKLVVALQFKWAWSDTCCVNQLDKGVQQESIVAMFRWYHGSSITIVHLLGVLSEFQEPGCLWRSIWNTRGWTYQEYVASKVVQFYTEDWKPYLGLQMFNHKESPVVLSEMERATNVTTQQLVTLQPGLDRAREKLYLASGRQTTREGDMAYSLFGIFGVALPVVYGERDLAVGRLLEYILTRSDEVAILAWTGRSGSLHSYVPANLTVYNEIVPPHVPAPIETSEMDRTVSVLRSSISDLSLPVALYERLYDLPHLSLVAGRLKLPGIVFRLGELTSPFESDPESDIITYHTTTPLLGDVEVKTTANLSGTRGLLLVHPWIGPLLDPDFSCDEALYDLPARALRLFARLWQPFGGLLLAPSSRSQYRRVATDSLIMIRILEEASLVDLMDAVRTVDVQ